MSVVALKEGVAALDALPNMAGLEEKLDIVKLEIGTFGSREIRDIPLERYNELFALTETLDFDRLNRQNYNFLRALPMRVRGLRAIQIVVEGI